MDNVDIKNRLTSVLMELKSIVNDSIEVRKQSKESRKQNAKVWEGFLKDFFKYVKVKGKESGDNLLWNISIFKIMK